MREDLGTLKALGKTVKATADYDPSMLDAFDNKHPDRDYWVTFTCPEFTTLCPKTGQPDFATLTIRYIPAKRLCASALYFAPTPPFTYGSMEIPPRAANLP